MCLALNRGRERGNSLLLRYSTGGRYSPATWRSSRSPGENCYYTPILERGNRGQLLCCLYCSAGNRKREIRSDPQRRQKTVLSKVLLAVEPWKAVLSLHAEFPIADRSFRMIRVFRARLQSFGCRRSYSEKVLIQHHSCLSNRLLESGGEEHCAASDTGRSYDRQKYVY